jgi:hypothetical protein
VLLLVNESMKVLAWIAAAAGYGRVLWRLLRGPRGQWAAAMALGVGLLAFIDWSLARLAHARQCVGRDRRRVGAAGVVGVSPARTVVSAA